jgi:hypothetical protein
VGDIGAVGHDRCDACLQSGYAALNRRYAT